MALFLAPGGVASAAAINSGASAQAESTWSFEARWRLRSEYLADSFRIVAPDRDHLQLSRLELRLGYRSELWMFNVEIQDSRAWGIETLSPIGSGDINALEPVNLNLGRRWVLAEDAELAVTVGRMTIDHGSRRLLARNQFRNTSNAFQAVHLDWHRGDRQTQLLYSMPLQREPGALDPDLLRGRAFRLDKAGSSERFSAVMHDYAAPDGSREYGAYAFLSHLSDREGRPTADRDLITAGARAVRRGNAYNAEFEAAYQWGDSLINAISPGVSMLRHRAWFAHAHVGIDVTPKLELRAAFDIATGDRDPFDDRNERFDRLYGARAFELGPSGIFGVAIRSNLRSPALRLNWSPIASHTLLLGYRWLRLDSPRDALVTAGRRDLSGESGRDLGEQWELRWRWAAPQSPVSLQVGAAYLDKGRYFAGSGSDSALNPPDTANSRYLFAQLIWIL